MSLIILVGPFQEKSWTFRRFGEVERARSKNYRARALSLCAQYYLGCIALALFGSSKAADGQKTSKNCLLAVFIVQNEASKVILNVDNVETVEWSAIFASH